MKSRMICIFSSVLSVLALLLLIAPEGLAANTEHTWGKISFQTGIPFSEPQDIGLDAVALVHPPESSMGEEQIEITLASVSQVLQESMENDEDIIAYVKTALFGVPDPASATIARVFQGQQVTGQTQSIDFPQNAELEYYLLPLSDGSKIFVAFKWVLNFSRAQVEEIISTVSLSFKEAK